MAHDESVTDNKHPLDDLAYDLVAVVKNKADALLAYHKYSQDAQAANSPECSELLRKMYEEDARHLMEAKQHLGAVLAGKMGQGRQQPGQKQAQNMAQGQQGQSMGKSSGQQAQGGDGQGQRR